MATSMLTLPATLGCLAMAQAMPERQQVVRTSDVSRYEALYGAPMNWSLVALVSPTARELPPPQKSIRTRGRLTVTPRSQATPDVKLCLPENPSQCLDLKTPAPEIAGVFREDVVFRNGHDADVTGAYVDGAFLFWSYGSAAPKPATPPPAVDAGAQSVLREADRYLGQEVSVRGGFAGDNLAGDLPAASRRGRKDWVLRDGGIAVWITGVEPKGSGWTLDPKSTNECVWRIGVDGVLERQDGVLYLKARKVYLLGRDVKQSCETGSPPARPRD
jgi:hypothetical protein